MKVYLTGFDGWHMSGESYGSLNFSVGIFSSREKAKEAIKQVFAESPEVMDYVWIKEIELDKPYELDEEDNTMCSYETDLSFGGYIE